VRTVDRRGFVSRREAEDGALYIHGEGRQRRLVFKLGGGEARLQAPGVKRGGAGGPGVAHRDGGSSSGTGQPGMWKGDRGAPLEREVK